jgi:arylsulfatase A-like enzyme
VTLPAALERAPLARLASALELILLCTVGAGLIEGALLIGQKGIPWSGRGAVLLIAGLTFPILALPQMLFFYALLGGLGSALDWRALRSPGFRAGSSLAMACLALPIAVEWNSHHHGFAPSAVYLVPYATILGGSLVAAVAVGLAVARLSAPRIRMLRTCLRIGVLGTLLASASLHAVLREDRSSDISRVAATRPDRPNIVLISIDTLRSDRLGSYGYTRATDPEIRRAFSDGIRFEDAVCPVPITRPSHAAMLTGRHVLDLGMRWNDRPLPGDVPTLAEVLGRFGYETAAFVSGWPLFGARSGLDRGFRVYDDDFDPLFPARLGAEQLTLPDTLRILGVIDTLSRSAQAVTQAALDWLEETPRRPFFAWLHYYDPHMHYNPPLEHARAMGLPEDGPRTSRWLYSRVEAGLREVTARERRSIDALYDGEVRYVDSQLGRFFEALRVRGLWDGTVVLLTADHGELLLERLASDGKVFTHSQWVDEEEIRVPFLIRGPGVPRGVEAGFTATASDIMPTLLHLAGIEVPPGTRGRDLFGDGRASLAARPAITINAPREGAPTLVSARAQGFRYTLDVRSGSDWLAAVHDGGDAPAEVPAEVAARLRATTLGIPLVSERLKLDADEEERLRVLGYVE